MDKKDKKFRKMEQEAPKPAVLFDFDGTLMDTDIAVIAAYREIFDRYKKGMEFTREVESEALTTVPEVMMKKYFPRRSTAKCVQELLDYMEQHLNDLIQPMHGVRRLLTWMNENGYPAGVLSDRSQSMLELYLKSSDMYDYFQNVRGNDTNRTVELEGSDIRESCRALGTEHCIYISDNPENIEAASKAGAYTVGFLSEYSDTLRFVEAHPDFMTASMDQIRSLLTGEPYWLAYVLTE
jgi:phosphoglycolate phosphatase-like HAD superfamily hydrolase